MSLNLWVEVDLGGPSPQRLDGFDWNYTYNVAPMWRELIGEPLGDFLEGKTLIETREALEWAAERMGHEIEHFRSMNPPNGWGSADGLHAALLELVIWTYMAPDGQWGVGA